MPRRAIARAFLTLGVVLVLAWGLTLGVVRSESVRIARMTCAIEPSTLKTLLSIDSQHSRSSGVPFVLVSVAECPPFSLHLSIWSTDAEAPEAINIKRAEIRYSDGTIQDIRLPPNGLRREFVKAHLSRSLPVEPRTYVDFPDSVTEPQDFTLFVAGMLEHGLTQKEFSQTYEVSLVEEASTLSGWGARRAR